MTPESLYFTAISAVSLACLIFLCLLMLYGLYRQARTNPVLRRLAAGQRRTRSG